MNKCLDEMKDLMVHSLQSEGESITKLEKADVLELTVKHLRKLKRQNALGLTPQATYAGRFKAGYAHCAQEVSNFMSHNRHIDVHVSTRLLSHLSSCIQALEVIPPSAMPPTTATIPTASASQTLISPSGPTSDVSEALDLSANSNLVRRRQLSDDSDSGQSSCCLPSADENGNSLSSTARRKSSSDCDSSWRPW